MQDIFQYFFKKLDEEYKSNYSRPNLELLFQVITKLFSYRSPCVKTRQSALIIKDSRIISFGYNGANQGSLNCIDFKEEGERMCGKDSSGSCFEGIHAEQNAIAFAAKNGIALEGCELYCTQSPCISCAKLIVASGIKKVYFLEKYRIMDGLNYLKQKNIELSEINI